jgi:psp operon transcriptional activator
MASEFTNSETPDGARPEALGQSEAFLTFQERLSRAAKVDRPVLLLGERGTGKELAASRLHFLSGRWEEPFVTLNCAALPPGLIESELFGHEKGAFTGAVERRTGRFELADGGTLFLDEVGAIPVEVQEKILRVVEYGVFERVGGSQSIRVDVRLVGATNADLAAMAEEGRFKADLLDRLSFEVLFLPPLRARREDILLLANHFASRMAHELDRADVPEFSDVAADALEAYAWPGNVRELKNVVERAVYRADGSLVEDIAFDPFDSPYRPARSAKPAATPAPPPPSFKDAIENLELHLLKDALERARFNQRKAADLLNLTYDQFRGYYRKHRKNL